MASRKPLHHSARFSAANPPIEYLNPLSLRKNPRNARTHSPRQIKKIAASIKRFGFLGPALIDGEDMIVAGHGRVDAAIQLSMPLIPTLRIGHLSPENIRAYALADNKIAEEAGWDRELLKIELQELSAVLDLDVTITGFEVAEIDILIGDTGSADKLDGFASLDLQKPLVSRLGDVWRVGKHRIYCGSALDAASYRALLQGMKAEMVFIDPPYNVAIEGNVSGLGRNKHREFAMASGEMSREEFASFLQKSFEHLVRHSIDGSIHFVCMDWRHLAETLRAGEAAYDELKNLCVWAKTNAGMGSFYRSQHELVFVFKNGTKPHVNNIELGRFGRNRSNVWSYAGANAFGAGRDTELAMHPTVKPVAMVADAILDCSKRGSIVLDAFAGSGTTLLAAEKTGRRGCAIELDARYVDVALERLGTAFGLEAVHQQSGKSFEQLARLRKKEISHVPAPC